MGLESAQSGDARAELAVSELERTGAFDRKVRSPLATASTSLAAESHAVHSVSANRSY
ncbi:alpha/beta-hydrolase family protein [Nocardia sp. CA-135398]|uniref:alpha/beta-hydrolase family protein n=1 Tax=Nocardia sp. CA-135398 TaxID=3239977 RepID=UPI003D9952CE